MEHQPQKRLARTAAILIFSSFATYANATLVSNATFQFNSASFFGLDFDIDGIIQPGEQTAISQFAPLALGVIQDASGSHVGVPDGGESPAIDQPWNLTGNTGMSETTSPIQILSDDGVGNVTLDFTGWGVDWNGGNVPLGGSIPADTGIATLTCAIDCAVGDTYILDYAAHTTSIGTSGSLLYTLHLEGTISAVPVPAAVWLFGSGLLGLIGMARRKQSV